MANSNYEDKIIEAIEAVVNSAVEKAHYDKTIQCQIIECVDATIGKYKVKYQDSSFMAYSESSDISYFPGADVYVLIPGNDMSRDKQILGTTKKLGANYAGNVVEEESLYNSVGTNCIDSDAEYEFCSYRTEVKTIYDRDNDINELRLNLKGVETYIKDSSSILCGGEFKTKLPVEQQFRGDFGVIFELAFYDNASNDTIVKNYVIDVNHMLGNPYKQTKWTRQYGILGLDTTNFRYVNKIYLFVKDFPHQSDDKPADIWMRNLEFCGMQRASDNELNSYGLNILTPQGSYFDDNDAETAVRKLQAQVRVKGRNIDNNSQNVSYYWFVENVGITVSNSLYCNYGGQGWECRNQKNLVGTDSNGNDIYEWVPGKWEFEVDKAHSQAKETKYKCVAIYNDVILTAEKVITNYSSNWDISIESDNGTQFYFDGGTTNLICRVNNEIKTDANFTYLWAEIDSANNFYSLGETTAENNEFNDAEAGYTQLKADIEAEKAMPAASQEQLDQYLTVMKKYDKIMRIERMFIHNLQVREITTFSTYKCSVYRDGVFLGSNSIVINNTLKVEDGYTLIINNGTQVFKYDEMGISPVRTTLGVPITISPLTFTIYDNLGRPIDDEIIKTCDIKWIVPASDTMLEIPDAYGEPTRDIENNTLIYENHLTAFSYQIVNKYDITKTNNNIKLMIDYKGTNLVAQTDLTFVKEGEPGTNGTEFVVKIEPNVPIDEIPPVYPMILNGEPNWNRRTGQEDKWFRLQMWHNGEIIYNGYTDKDVTTENETISLEWSMLSNKYNALIVDESDIEVADSASGSFRYRGYTANSETGMPANIVRCKVTYGHINYYATLPIITGIAETGYKVSLAENSGFRYATYSADGRRPQYDNSSPFEVIVNKNINGFEEDVSRMIGTEAVDYEWTVKGRIYNPVSHSWEIDKKYLIEEDKLAERNQKWFKPIDEYNDECVNVGLECRVTYAGAVAASIHIPVHLLLNRYGQAAINDWDGNSVSVDENGNGVILAPQVGAGIKESDNSFTGMLMGKVKEVNQSTPDIGLLGYYKGQRSLYLSAYDGYGIFGKEGSGQIILDPSSSNAMLYSHNFWAKYHDDNTGANRNGLPITNYIYDENRHKYDGQNNTNTGNEQTDTNSGMLIDLTTPRILFGNGNFRIEPNGFLYAKGGGEIAGWHIDDYKIYKEKTGMSSVDDALAEGATIVKIKRASASADWVEDSQVAAFWAGKNKFFVSHDGYLKVEEASIGSGTAPIFIGKDANGDHSAIYSGRKSTFNANASGFYIGTDGISLGTLNSNNESKFQVTNAGTLTARDGTIGGWKITRNTIATNNVTLNSNGNIDCTGGKGWYIHNDGTASFGGGNLIVDKNGDVQVKGEITATSGTIDGWTIESGRLFANGVSLRSGGSGVRNIEVNNGTFYVLNDGSVYSKRGEIGGWTLSETALTSKSKSVTIDGQSNKIRWEKDKGFFICGDGTTHPRVSALNVSLDYGGIVLYSGLTVEGAEGKSEGSFKYLKTSETEWKEPAIGLEGNGGVGSFLTSHAKGTSYDKYVVVTGSSIEISHSKIDFKNVTNLSINGTDASRNEGNTTTGKHFFGFQGPGGDSHYAKFIHGIYVGVTDNANDLVTKGWERD